MPFFSFLFVSCTSEDGVKVYNSAPTITITSHSPEEIFRSGYEVTFQAQVQDDNHEASELAVEWTSNGRTLCPTTIPTADGVSQCITSLEEGESLVRVQVTDPELSAAIAEIAVEVEPTFAPTVDILSPTAQGLYYRDQIILFSARILDNEDEAFELVYSWDSSLDGNLPTSATPNEDGLIEEYLYLTEGTHALTLSATDLSGKSTEKSISVLVGGTNTAPSCEITAPNDGESFVVGESIIFRGMATDSEVDVANLDVMWISDTEGELGSGVINSSGEISLSYSQLSADTHNIQLTVKDELESTCSDSIIISVTTENAPVLTLTSPLDGDVISSDDSVAFSGMVSDVEDAPGELTLSWVSDIDGEFSTTGANSNGVIGFNISSLSPGMHSITAIATDTSGLTDSKVSLVKINQLPTIPTVQLIPNPAYTSDILSATASSSIDEDGDGVTYLYEWYQNNSITSNTTTIVQSNDTTKGDTWTVRVTPNDGYQNGPYAETSVVIINSPPLISSVIPSATQATTSQTLSCTGSSSDPDGDALIESYEWSNTTTQEIIASFASITLTPLSVSPGDSLSCTYTSSDGAQSQSQSSVVSIINSNPSIDSILLVPSSPYLGDTLSCMGSVSDPDLESVSEEYLWENLTTSDTLSTDSSIMLDTNIASPNDVISCTLTTTDGFGGEDTDVVTAIVGNLPPSIDSLTFDASILAIGDTIVCLSSESDPEGEIPSVAYEWMNESTGVSIGSSPSLTLLSSMGTGLDEISCTAVATDSYGATDSEQISIFVEETVPEFTAQATISPSSGLTTSSSLGCTGVAMDPDGTSVTLTYAWKNGATTIGSSQSITLSPSLVQPTDIVECIITATDGAGEQTTSSDSVMIGNTAPVIDSLVITPSSGVDTSTTLTCFTSVSDADLETLTPTYTWKSGITILGSGVSLTLTPSIVQPSDNVTCEASVTDGFGATQIDSVSVTVDNTAPVVSSVSISPTTTYNDSSLTCSVVASDVDNQSLTTSYVWNNDTTSATLGTSSTLVLSSSTATRNDIISCTVTVADTSGEETTETTNVTLQNRAPNAPTVAVEPSMAYVDSTLACTISSVVDPDEDVVSYQYEWTVNGSAVVETSSTFAGGFTATDTVLCSVTPNDGLVDGTAGSSSVVIVNSPPVVTSITLDPNPAYTNSLLSATATHSDADGDTVQWNYIWRVDSNEVQNGSINTLASTLFSKGETVTVSVVANDGTDNSIESTASTVVGNTPPTSPSISIDPVAPIEGDSDLVCSIDVVSSDLDGDSLDYSFAWTVDGVAYTAATDTALGSTISISVPQSQEEWICYVTANDGEDDGGVASTAVQIQAQETFLDQLCGYSNQGEFCGGNCSNNTAAFADAYCQVAGFNEAASYTEHTSGSFSNVLYYNESSTGLPESCSDIIYSSSYGLNSSCTCVRDLYCQ